MSFQAVRHEHPNIFVVNRQTYETYRVTVGDSAMLSFDGAPSDLNEARRTAIAFLIQMRTKEYPASMASAQGRAQNTNCITKTNIQAGA